MDLDARLALIVVDVQSGTLKNFDVVTAAGVVEHVASLIAAFRRLGLPVVLAKAVGTPPGRTDAGGPSLEWPEQDLMYPKEISAEPSDIQVQRRAWSVFAGTGLQERLHGLGVRQVVISGLASGFGVESTGRAAYDLGFDVVFIADAIADPRPGAHDALVRGLFRILGQVATTAELRALLSSGDSQTGTTDPETI